jgi:hypothetical protein
MRKTLYIISVWGRSINIIYHRSTCCVLTSLHCTSMWVTVVNHGLFWLTSTSNSLNSWNILSPIACWTWWWPLSRPKHVVQLISFITDQLVVFWLPYTAPLCYTHNADASTQDCFSHGHPYYTAWFDRKLLGKKSKHAPMGRKGGPDPNCFIFEKLNVII